MVGDMDASLEAHIQRNQCLGSDDPWDTLNNTIQDTHQVIIINSVELDKHRIRSRREVAFDDLRNIPHTLGYLLVEGATLQAHPDVGTSIVAYFLGVDVVFKGGQHSTLEHTGEALIDR